MTASAEINGCRFPRQARLTRPVEFKRVFAGAKRLGDRYLTVLAIPNDVDHPRLGMAIARRAVPTAVGRNRIKRLARETFRQHQAQLGAWDIVVLAKPGARHASTESLRLSLERSWQRLFR